MVFLSISTFAAALIGALISVGVFVFLPKIKSASLTRHHIAYITAGLSIAVALLSFVSLQFVNLSSAPPGDVTAVAPPTVGDPAQTSAPMPAPPKRITIVIPLSEVLDAHSSLLSTTTRQYERRFPSAEGFRIVEAKFSERSATRVGGFSIQTTDKEAIVRFQLTSGPSVDRFRGWLHGDLTLVQEEIIQSQ